MGLHQAFLRRAGAHGPSTPSLGPPGSSGLALSEPGDASGSIANAREPPAEVLHVALTLMVTLTLALTLPLTLTLTFTRTLILIGGWGVASRG